jgi:hypothetical protein
VAPLQKRQQQQQTRPLTPDFSSPVVSAASHSLSVRFSDDVAQVTLMTSNTHMTCKRIVVLCIRRYTHVSAWIFF